MTDNEPKIPAAPPRQRPAPPGQAVQLTEEEKEHKRQEIVNSAPLQTNPDDATNPPAEDKPKRSAKPKVKPWRSGFQDRHPSELMKLKSKTSFTQVKELELRLDFILSEKNNNRGLDPKIYMNNLILEALDQYTIRELKELGHEVD